MDPLHSFLRFLHERYDNPFRVDGDIYSNDPIIRELALMDPYYNLKFSLQVNEPNRVVHLVENWSPRAGAEIKHIYWRDLDNLVTIYYHLRYIEVSTRSNLFMTECKNYANTLQFDIRRV
uniref:Uncharacterized protein n=1 Tax=viral metagenome TaxID=1070528 RepID=A0A6C0JY23_9ZZZZ